MRLLWLLLALLLAGGIYLYLNPDAWKQLRNLPVHTGIGKQTAQLYKWRNQAGEWQVTDYPPPQGIEFETLEYRSDVNVLPVPPQLLKE